MTEESAKIAQELGLSQQEILFCEIYWGDSGSMGNGTRSYAKAFEIDLEQGEGETEQEVKIRFRNASTACSKLIYTSRIQKYLAFINKRDFNNEAIDRQLHKIINQNGKLEPKLGAIREFNRLKARILDKIDLTSDGQPLQFEISESIAKKVGILNENKPEASNGTLESSSASQDSSATPTAHEVPQA